MSERESRDRILSIMGDGYLDLHDTEDAEEMDYLKEVLNKDSPKEPKKTFNGHWYCPNDKCNQYVHLSTDIVFFRYCSWCGQRLDWTEEQERMRKHGRI